MLHKNPAKRNCWNLSVSGVSWGRVSAWHRGDSLLRAEWGGFWIPEVLWPGFCKLERKSGCWGCRQLVLAGVDCSVLLLAPGSSRGYIRGNEEEMGKCRALSRVCKISVI